ncbi:orotidine-5'-phosphate decarboxylase [Fusobacterium gonidiaformans]|uniref:orotidine-5'-phosphate decarboxylase n=1 Tax=Fusobacterium gonidiaformans TaxID=849 RepID=UPI0023F2BEA3|nr:orotidine-5'-phosphate decarboxylase [Fusobacterium gonidiaformans]
MDAREKIIIALDFPTEEKAKACVESLGEEAVFYKVGLELFLNSQGKILEYLREKGKKIFLDLKFHDIPNTTAMASVFAAKKDVVMFNVHASGGKKMMQKVIEETKKINEAASVIAVTILTSFSEEEIQNVFQSKLSLKELAIHFASLAKEAGLSGVVCSPWEAADIKKVCGESFQTVCPGVRPKWSATNDQERIMTPKEAVQHGCDYLVIGRPVTKHENPKEAMRMIVKEVEEGLGLC